MPYIKAVLTAHEEMRLAYTFFENSESDKNREELKIAVFEGVPHQYYCPRPGSAANDLGPLLTSKSFNGYYEYEFGCVLPEAVQWEFKSMLRRQDFQKEIVYTLPKTREDL